MEVKVCRICLAQDVKLYDICVYNLKTSYETLTNNMVGNDGLPRWLCWECGARLLSCGRFRDKALRSQVLLANMASIDPHDISGKLKSLDREEHNLVSSLGTSAMVDYSDVTCRWDERCNADTAIEHVFIKQERDSDSEESETAACSEFEIEVKCEPFHPDMLDVRLEEEPDEILDPSSSDATKKRKLNQKRTLAKVIKKENSQKSQGTNENKFKCDQCRKSFTVKSDLENHLYTHRLLDMCNKAAEAELTCVHCKTVCHTRKYLLEHTKLKHNVEIFTCSDCDFTSDDADVLVEHEVVHNQNRTYKCIICLYRAVQYEHLKQHVMTVHSQEKPFRCTLCDYRCTRKCNLKLHERTHTGERPYKCDICDYAAAQPTTLKQHVLSTHAPDKPIKCKFCPYTCSQKCDMVRHERIHTGEKPFLCTHCNYRTARSNDLQQHLLRIHAGETSYPCDMCSYAATAKANLRKHKRRIHMKKASKCRKTTASPEYSASSPQSDNGFSNH